MVHVGRVGIQPLCIFGSERPSRTMYPELCGLVTGGRQEHIALASVLTAGDGMEVAPAQG